jgi:3-phenylpropionate/trans-cinnamate dioxygenase ferredoxin component
MAGPDFVAVAKLADVPAGQILKVELAGQAVLLCNSLDRIFAIAATCSHADEPLECGRMRNGWISCPAHGARFDLETGKAMNPPAKDPIRVFPVRIVGDRVEIAV